LVVNGKAPNDLWYADGYAGSSAHGVFHSTDGGQTFQQLPGISHAITIAVGAGSGKPGDAAYSVYFYGLTTSSPDWGIFQSTNGGSSWNRISYYPTGIYDVPRAMAASQDNFGKVYVGFSGNSFAYGQTLPTNPTPPGAPTGLTATASSGSEIDLAWTAPAGGAASYSVFRGTAAGGESATALVAGVTGVSYADKSVNSGMKYYYEVAAVNVAGQGPDSNEASATAVQPTVALAAATGSSTSATVTAGQSATYQLVLNSTNYSGTVNFTCTGAPAGDTCAVPSPVSITPTISTTPVTVTVQTSGSAAKLDGGLARGLVALAAGLLVLPIGRRRRRRMTIAMLLVAVALLTAANGCGSGSGGGGSKSPVTSTLTVSASGPGLATATQSLTLTVQ
jgi:hypothetical protein